MGGADNTGSGATVGAPSKGASSSSSAASSLSGSGAGPWWLDADTGDWMADRTMPAAAVNLAEQGVLLVLTGMHAGRVFTVGGDGCVIGRGREATLVFEDTGVSRVHALIRRTFAEDGRPRFTIEDLGSKNGTRINGRDVVGRLPLLADDRIQIGHDLVFRFSIGDSTEIQLARQLYEASTRDPLTGVYNRRYFDERLASELAFAQRHAANVTVVMLDVDRFKDTNDAHGHLVGDMVLRAVATDVARLIRAEDVFARFGGEEFVLLVRGIPHANVVHFAERVRRAVERLEVRVTDAIVKVTVSCGVASLAELGASGVTHGDALVALADGRLYAAKTAGRNRVVAS